jgi:hypothetical protein
MMAGPALWRLPAGRRLRQSRIEFQSEQRTCIMLPGTTMIRHASLSGPVTAISFGVHGATTGSCLMTSASFPLLVAAGFLGAGSDAVGLPMIAPPTQTTICKRQRAHRNIRQETSSMHAAAHVRRAKFRPSVLLISGTTSVPAVACFSTAVASATTDSHAAPRSSGMILAGRGAAVKAGLRPPPSAAVGLDCGSPPSRRCHHRFDASERLDAPGSTRAATPSHAGKKARILTGVHNTPCQPPRELILNYFRAKKQFSSGVIEASTTRPNSP